MMMKNISKNQDTVQVMVESPDTGDSETVTLKETESYSGVFRNTAAFPVNIGTANINDGTLQYAKGENL